MKYSDTMSRKTTVVAVALVVLVLLAGCNSPFSDEGGTVSTERTVEKVTETTAVTTTAVTLDDVTLPEGANRQRIGNATALAEAYASAVRNSSYEIEFEKSRVLEDGTRTDYRRIVRKKSLETDEEYQYLNQTSDDGNRTAVSYLNGTEFYEKFVMDETTYQVSTVPPNSVEEFQPTIGMVTYVRSRLQAGEYENPRIVRRDGRQFVEYRLTGIEGDAKFVLADSITNVSGSVLVGPNGVVRRISMNLTKGGRGPDTYLRSEFRLVETDEVIIHEPEWTDKALMQADDERA